MHARRLPSVRPLLLALAITGLGITGLGLGIVGLSPATALAQDGAAAEDQIVFSGTVTVPQGERVG